MDSLPVELCLMITESIDRKTNLQTILNLRAVSRKWRAIATRYVYVHVPTYGNDFHTALSDPLGNLCWKLAQKPELAHFVKEVSEWPESYPWVHGPLNPPPQDSELLYEMYFRTLDQAGPSLSDSLKDEIASRLSDESGQTGSAALAFIFAMCAEIEVVTIPYIEEGYHSMIRQVVWTALNRALPLEIRRPKDTILGRVKHLCLGDYVHGFSVADALDILSLPKLEHLTLMNLGDLSNNSVETLPAPSAHPRVTKPINLTFESCFLSAAGLSCILAACANPRSLFIRMRTRNTDLAPCFAKPLARHGKKLQSLVLDTTAFSTGLAHTHDPPTAAADFLGAVSRLPSLRMLVLSRADFKRSVDLESASLRELMVLGTDYSDKEEEEEEDIASFEGLVRGPRTPSLRRVAYLPHRLDCLGNWNNVYGICSEERQIPDRYILGWHKFRVYSVEDLGETIGGQE